MNIPQQQVPLPEQSKRVQYSESQFLHTFLTAALLPLVQALITGAMVFMAIWVIAYFLFDALDPHRPAFIIGVLTVVITWFYLQRRWITLTSIEKWLNIDLNHDNQIGEPKKEPDRVRISLSEIKENSHYKVDNVDLPISDDKLRTFATALLNGAPLSERYWTGSGKPFSSPEFRALMSVMDARGLREMINPKDKRQGYKLTRGGRALMNHFASPSPTADTETE